MILKVLFKFIIFVVITSITSPSLAQRNSGVGFVLLNAIKRMGMRDRSLGDSLFRCDEFKDSGVDYVVLYSPTNEHYRLFQRGSGDELSCDPSTETLEELVESHECFSEKLETLSSHAIEISSMLLEQFREERGIEPERQSIKFIVSDSRNSVFEAVSDTYAYLGSFFGASAALAEEASEESFVSTCPYNLRLVIETEYRRGNSIRTESLSIDESEL